MNAADGLDDRPAGPARAGRLETVARAGLIVVAALLAGMFTDAAPTGLAGPDAFWRGALAVVVVFAASAARPWALVWLTGAVAATAAAGGSTLLLGVAVALVVAAAVHLLGDEPVPLLPTAVGVGAALCLLDLPSVGPDGSTALIVVVAVVPLVVSGWRWCSTRTWRIVRRTAIGASVLGGLGLFVFAVSAALAWRAGGRAVGESTAWIAAAKSGDQAGAVAHLREAADAFDEGTRSVSASWTTPARMLPGLGRYLDAVATVSSAGSELTLASKAATESASIDNLRPRQGKFDLAVMQRAKGPLADTIATARRVAPKVSGIDNTWLIAPVRDRIEEFSSKVDQAIEEGDLALAALDVAPSLLGGQGTRHYFVLFTTPSESRELGGFLGNFGELTVTDGKIELSRTGRTNVLNAGLTEAQVRAKLAAQGGGRIAEAPRSPELAPDLVAGQLPGQFPERFVAYDPGRFWNNITGTPDLPTVARAVADLYPQSGGERPIDGVIYVDPFAIEALLQLTGPITVEGMEQPIDSTNAASFLLRDQYLTIGDVGERADLLERVSRETFDRLTKGDLAGPRTFADALGPMVAQRHLAFWSLRPTDQPFLDRVGISGRFPAASPDLVAVTQSNDNPGKADALWHRELRYEAAYDAASGRTVSELRVTLYNDIPSAPAELAKLPDYVVGNLRGFPRGTNRTFLSAYTPLNLDRLTVGGTVTPSESYNEYGVRRFGAFIEVPAGAKVEVVFQLSGTLKLDGGYGLTAWSPPLATPDRLSIVVGSGAAVGSTADRREQSSDQSGIVVLDRR